MDELNGYAYVVRFEDGRYFSGNMLDMSKCVDDLAEARQYAFEWMVEKDLYLTVFVEETGMSYEVCQVKNTVELVKEDKEDEGR